MYKKELNMYITVKEAAEYLQMKESFIKGLIQEGEIRALFDGEQYLVNKEQFTHHLEQVEKLKKEYIEYMSEPIPEDMDIKDED